MFERLNRMTQLTTSREAQVSGQGSDRLRTRVIAASPGDPRTTSAPVPVRGIDRLELNEMRHHRAFWPYPFALLRDVTRRRKIEPEISFGKILRHAAAVVIQ